MQRFACSEFLGDLPFKIRCYGNGAWPGSYPLRTRQSRQFQTCKMSIARGAVRE